jgi:hypothetical protein
MVLLTWFLKEHSYKGYSDVTPPNECPKPVIILQDDGNDNNTDHSVDPELECKIQGKHITSQVMDRIQLQTIQYLTALKILCKQCLSQLSHQC